MTPQNETYIDEKTQTYIRESILRRLEEKKQNLTPGTTVSW
jgi:hypothetical protein